MAGLQDIRRRIRPVKDTQQVTKAMSRPLLNSRGLE